MAAGDSAWASLDPQTAARRNREWILGRLLAPLYDIDADTPTPSVTVTPVTAGVALGSSIGDVLAVSSGIGVALVTNITITNTDSSARTASLYLIEPGQTAASVARTIFNDTLLAGQRLTIRVPYFLAASATIRGLASQASVVAVRVDAIEFDAMPDGLNLLVVEGAALTTSLATLYTAGTTGIASPAQAVLLAATLCNTDSSARTPELHIVPSGGSAAVANQIWKQSQLAKQTAWLEAAESMVSGDFIQAKASTTSVVSARLTILEME